MNTSISLRVFLLSLAIACAVTLTSCAGLGLTPAERLDAADAATIVAGCGASVYGDAGTTARSADEASRAYGSVAVTIQGSRGGSFTTSLSISTLLPLVLSGTVTFNQFKVRYENEDYLVSGTATLNETVSFTSSSAGVSQRVAGTLTLTDLQGGSRKAAVDLTVALSVAVGAEAAQAVATVNGTVDGQAVALSQVSLAAVYTD